MSQRTFIANGDYHVFTGWDKPLQRFFLVIEEPRQADPNYTGDDYAFSNLNLPDPAMTLGQIAGVLHEFKIMPPPGLWDDLGDDSYYDRGNYVVDYGKYEVDYTP